MKKLVIFILMLTLIVASLFSLTACGEEEEELSAKIEEKVIAYQTDLQDSAATLTSSEAVCDYLTNWAKSKGIACSVDSHDNIIMTVKASKEYKDADPTVVLCSYDPKQFENCIEPMAVALYLAKNNEKTGKLTVIFTKESGHDFSGIQKLSSKYFTDNTNVFCLNRGSGNMWSLNTGARSTYQFTGPVTYTAPTKDKAYKITIEGLPGGVPDSKISSYPNAIKEIGDLLAYFKTNAFIFELADVSGGTDAGIYPKEASVTVVINQNDDEKFQSRMETAIDNFNDDYLENYPDVTYTYEEVDLPKQVVSQESQNDLIKTLYTLIDGIHYRDEENEQIVSISSIGSIKLKDNTYTIQAIGNSLTDENLSDIDNDYKTICGLADITYKKTDSQNGWSGDPESDLALACVQAFNDYCGKEMEFKDYVAAANTTYVQEKNPKCSIVNVSVNEDRLERYTGTILTFLMNQEHEDTKD